jgi:hypothetical protein
MFGDDNTLDFFGQSDVISALAELEQSSQENVARMRAHERLTVRIGLTVQPGNSSARTRAGLECVTADISDGGCMVLAPRPLVPGDVYWLTFDATRLAIGSLFARCMRCRFISEDAFEVGFRFFAPAKIVDAIKNTDDLDV